MPCWLASSICFFHLITIRRDAIATSAMCFEWLDLRVTESPTQNPAGDSHKHAHPLSSPATFSSSVAKRDLQKENQNSEADSSATCEGASRELRWCQGLTCFHPFYSDGLIFSGYIGNKKNASLQGVLITSPRTLYWMRGLKRTPMLHLVTLYYAC